MIARKIAEKNRLKPEVEDVAVQSLNPYDNHLQHGSDMRLLMHLAKQHNFETYVYWNSLYFHKRSQRREPFDLSWGKNLGSFNPRLSTSGQKGMIALQDYDHDLHQKIDGLMPVTANEVDLDQIVERLGSSFIDKLNGFGKQYVSEIFRTRNFANAKKFARAILEDLLEGLYEGSGSCIGMPEMRAGETVNIRGLGKRFSGKYRLRRVVHTIDSGGYRTSFDVTQRSGTSMLHLFRKSIEDKSSPHKRPGAQGAIIGTVEKNVDKENFGRIQVRYPWGDGKTRAWAKVMPPNTGMYFMPDRDDDVLLIFENGDFNRPVVIGMPWNVKKKPPESSTSENNIRVIQSRSGHRIMLDDTKGKEKIRLESKSGAHIELDEKGDFIIRSAKGAEIRSDGKDIHLNK